ncbi:patatin-like phospholipase family protein [Sessilibacter sp. MAH2]
MSRALVLSGGGARAAYQVGVLNAVNDIIGKSETSPFPIICGTSAGAINALALASHLSTFDNAIADLVTIWDNLHVENVVKAGWKDIALGVKRLTGAFFNQGIAKSDSIALLDNSPLKTLLQSHINFSNLKPSIESGKLHAVAVTAMAYSTGESISFFQGHSSIRNWRRYNRLGLSTELSIDHLLASSAIPGVFPSVKINDEYYGDGAVRQLSPLSTALQLGADKIFIVGVSDSRNPEHWNKRHMAKHSPSMGQMFGHLLDSAFLDSMDADLEHLEHVNDLINLIPAPLRVGHPKARKIESISISPTKDVDRIAGRHVRYLPKPLKAILASSGATAKGGGAGLASYLLFSNKFTKTLMDLGYQDAMWERDKILRFFED